MTTPPRTALIRCMGGSFCAHRPGTCTATAPRPSGDPGGAVALPTAVRDPADEARATAIAFGLFALEAPLSTDPRTGWDRLTDSHRALFQARARFVLATAADYQP